MKALWWSLSVVFVLTACGGGGGGSASNGVSSNANVANQESPSVAMQHDTQNSSSAASETNAESDAGTDPSYGFLDGSVEPTQIVSSVITGIDYPVQIYLPEGYTDSGKTYPIVYALDGQTQFPGLPYLLEQAGGEAILVAISQGPDDRRRTDYLLPGARAYFQFLTVELMPLIEPMYRVDTSDRTIVGTSFGGVFATVAMLLDDVSAPHFANYLAFDASLYQHSELTRALLDSRYAASGEMTASYFVSSALPEGNDAYVTEFIARLSRKNFARLQITQRRYEVSHGKVSEPSFSDAVRLLLTP